MKKLLVLSLVALFAGGMAVTYAADAVKDAKEAVGIDKDKVKTLQGVVVDLKSYLAQREAGKDPLEASRVEVKVDGAGGKTEVDVKKTDKADRGGMGHIKGFVVTEKTWLSKITPGQELYVVLPGSEGAGALDLHQYLGKRVNLTGKVVDQDGVRAICVTGVEAVTAAADEKK